MENKRRSVKQVFVCIALLCMIWVGYFVMREVLDRRIEIMEDDFSWMYQIDGSERKNDTIIINGFAFKINQSSLSGNYEVVLRNVENGEMLFPKMQYEERLEVKEYFKLTDEFHKLGFIATIDTNKFSDVMAKYEILLRVKGEKTSYRTETYIVNGELMINSPELTSFLNIEGTVVEEVVMNGVLRAWNSQEGVYIYQYEGDLYWITDEKYVFDENNDVFMRCQILVIEDEESDTYSEWIGKGFLFSENELSNSDMGLYRIARFYVPREYSIEKIKVGEKNEEWKWVEYFRPRYEW